MAQEKLIVKNFGPIKDAEIELGKVTVFIGEQASGKSVLAKLVAIFKDLDVIINAKKKVFSDFRVGGFINQDTYIEFINEHYHINFNDYGKEKGFGIVEPMSLNLSNSVLLFRDLFSSPKNYSPEKRKEIEDKIFRFISNPIYFPAERALIPLISESLFTFNNLNIPLPKFLLNFGSEYELAKSNQDKNSTLIPIIDVVYESKDGFEFIILDTGKGETVQFQEASSGFHSIIPLYFVLEEKSKDSNQLFIIEEPELNLYPTTQKKLIEYLAEKTDNNSLILTTHSPYILSSLDNLIQAGNVIKKHPELKEEVEKIIPTKYHLNYEDVKVYFVADGTARLIMNEEYQSIDVSELDEVSEGLNADFEKLLDLKYQD